MFAACESTSTIATVRLGLLHARIREPKLSDRWQSFSPRGAALPALPYAASRYPHKHTQDTAPELNQSTFDAAVKAVSDLIEQYAYDPTGVLDPTVSSRHQCGHA